jgi:hypothetical protein
MKTGLTIKTQLLPRLIVEDSLKSKNQTRSRKQQNRTEQDERARYLIA